MADKKYIAIKERILKQAMELWGVTDVSDMDPVVDLLLDVFAYESSKLHQEIEQSDSRILHRLSRILIDHKWSLPTPAHALLTITPNKGEQCMLEVDDHFYAEKSIFGKGDVQIFMTPLFAHELVDAKIKALIHDTEICFVEEKAAPTLEIFNKRDRLPDYCVWMGIDIDKERFSELVDLTLCIKPSDWSLVPFLKNITFHDCKGNRLSSVNGINISKTNSADHYFNEIKDYYNDLYFTVDLSQASKVKHSLHQMFPDAFKSDETTNLVPLLWLKVNFPIIFSKEQLGEIEIYLNTFPVVNRQLIYKQHDFSSTGKIIPLRCPKKTQFLNILQIEDNTGCKYVNRLNQFDEKPTGVYSLYFGELERFDSDNARSMISKVLQLMKEDGNAFAAMNPDALSTQLKDLFKKINEIEKSLDSSLKEDNKVKAFILTVPRRDASTAEIKYWVTSGTLANGLDERTLVQQFNTEKYDASGLFFRTRMQGGSAHDTEQDLINSLRYGLLTRDRIVSKEDIRSYILHKIGKYVEDIDIRNGVSISSDPKKGIIRTTEIRIKLHVQDNLSIPDLPELAQYLERDLAQRSVCNSSYKLVFHEK